MTLSIRAVFELGLIQIKKDESHKKIFSLRLDRENVHMDREWVWIVSGLIAVFGTIVISELISIVVYPIILLRYLYPSFIMIWLLFAINISKCRLGRLWTALLVTFVFMTCYPTYLDTIKSERTDDRRLKSTLTATTSKMGGNDFIYTDIVHFAWTVADVYYPGTPHELFGHTEWWRLVELPELDEEKDYWLFLGAPISEGVTVRLREMGYESEIVVDRGFIGTGNVWVYKAVPETEDAGGTS